MDSAGGGESAKTAEMPIVTSMGSPPLLVNNRPLAITDCENRKNFLANTAGKFDFCKDVLLFSSTKADRYSH
jgi:hypothetical protein